MPKKRQLKDKTNNEVRDASNLSTSWLGWRMNEKPAPVKEYITSREEVDKILKSTRNYKFND